MSTALLSVVLTLLAQTPPSTAIAAASLTDGDRVLLAVEAIETDARREAPSAAGLGTAVNVMPDQVIARNVQEVLSPLAAHLRSLSVSCNRGQVTLKGQAASEKIRLRAASLADGVVGAREVVNRLSTPEQEAEAWNPPPLPDLPTESKPIDFLTQDGLCGAGIVVRVEDGIIYLEDGMVGSDRARDYATEAAQFVPGGRSVKNNLAVLQTTAENDKRLGVIITKRISYTPGLQHLVNTDSRSLAGRAGPMGLQVTVKEGVATVTGTVETRAQEIAVTEVVLASNDVLVFDDQIVVASTR